MSAESIAAAALAEMYALNHVAVNGSVDNNEHGGNLETSKNRTELDADASRGDTTSSAEPAAKGAASNNSGSSSNSRSKPSSEASKTKKVAKTSKKPRGSSQASKSQKKDATTNTTTTTNNKKCRKGKQREKFPVEPRVIQIIKKPRTYMNHSYRDFSSVPFEEGDEFPTDISEMTFPQKVHHMLSQPEHSKFITWQPHGRAFRIIIPKMFEAKVCSKYFQHTRYSSFLRELSNYSFKHITQGEDRNCYYHEFMLRGLPHLCKYMPSPKDARRLIPDPENEPDFYAISEAYPLPDDEEYRRKEAAKPAPEDELPQAGTPRCFSDLVGFSTDCAPPAKRSRVVAAPRPNANAATSESAIPTSLTSNTAGILSSLLTPTAHRNILNNHATSLSGAASGIANLASPPRRMGATAAGTALAAATASGGLPMNNTLAVFRPPQMQAAMDRNNAVLAAFGAAQHQAAMPLSRNDPAATLAAALLQQQSNGRLHGSSYNPRGASSFGRF